MNRRFRPCVGVSPRRTRVIDRGRVASRASRCLLCRDPAGSLEDLPGATEAGSGSADELARRCRTRARGEPPSPRGSSPGCEQPIQRPALRDVRGVVPRRRVGDDARVDVDEVEDVGDDLGRVSPELLEEVDLDLVARKRTAITPVDRVRIPTMPTRGRCGSASAGLGTGRVESIGQLAFGFPASGLPGSSAMSLGHRPVGHACREDGRKRPLSPPIQTSSSAGPSRNPCRSSCPCS